MYLDKVAYTLLPNVGSVTGVIHTRQSFCGLHMIRCSQLHTLCAKKTRFSLPDDISRARNTDEQEL